MNENNDVVVITGAASGLGLALTKACLQQGKHVVMADNAATVLQQKAEELQQHAQSEIVCVVCDVSVRDDVKRLANETYAHFNRVNLLINNAGISGHFAPIWEQTNEQVRQVLEVNLHGVIHGVQEFLPKMLMQNHRSHVVNMASFYGLCSGSQMAAYAMSKHAIVALSESLYFDLHRLNKPVDVSVVCPSFANTQLLTNSTPQHEDKFHAIMSDLIERSRPAEDVADHILSEVRKNVFYILPDKEVKDYCGQRTKAIVEQTAPHVHAMEKILSALSKRAIAAE